MPINIAEHNARRKTALDFDEEYSVKIGKETKPHQSSQKRWSIDIFSSTGAHVLKDGFIDEYGGKFSFDMFTEKDIRKLGITPKTVFELVPKGGKIKRPKVPVKDQKKWGY